MKNTERPIFLLALAGTSKGKYIEINKNLFVIGRNPDCDLKTSNPIISRMHATIEKKNGQIFICDQSANGTYLNGQRLEQGKITGVSDGDLIEIGPLRFIVIGPNCPLIHSVNSITPENIENDLKNIDLDIKLEPKPEPEKKLVPVETSYSSPIYNNYHNNDNDNEYGSINDVLESFLNENNNLDNIVINEIIEPEPESNAIEILPVPKKHDKYNKHDMEIKIDCKCPGCDGSTKLPMNQLNKQVICKFCNIKLFIGPMGEVDIVKPEKKIVSSPSKINKNKGKSKNKINPSRIEGVLGRIDNSSRIEKIGGLAFLPLTLFFTWVIMGQLMKVTPLSQTENLVNAVAHNDTDKLKNVINLEETPDAIGWTKRIAPLLPKDQPQIKVIEEDSHMAKVTLDLINKSQLTLYWVKEPGKDWLLESQQTFAQTKIPGA